MNIQELMKLSREEMTAEWQKEKEKLEAIQAERELTDTEAGWLAVALLWSRPIEKK